MNQQRNLYKIDTDAIVWGKVGHLQTLKTLYLTAGTIASLNVTIPIAMQQLRREVNLPAYAEAFVFSRKMRHTYGDQWKEMIQEGPTYSTAFPNNGLVAADVQDVMSFGRPSMQQLGGLWLTENRANIWNEYFCNTTLTRREATSGTAAVGVSTDIEKKRYGPTIARLPDMATTGIGSGVMPAATDQDVSSAADFSLDDLRQTQNIFESKMQRAFNGQRYRDIIRAMYDVSLDEETDERAKLEAYASSWLSGYDVDGTSTGNHGVPVGKSQGVLQLNMKPTMFMEHCHLWIMIVVRYPFIHEKLIPYLDTKPIDYSHWVGDPDFDEAQQPTQLMEDDIFFGNIGPAAELGYMPWGQWHRTESSHIFGLTDPLGGYPGLKTNPDDHEGIVYHQNDDYDHIFSSPDQRGHYQVSAGIIIDKETYVPDIYSSIFAGTRTG